MWETWEIAKKGDKKEASESGGKKETDTFLFFLLFVWGLICPTLRKSIYDDNPRASNESSFAMGKFLPENVTNLGKMNHSHFIWTSVLTPAPLLHTFIHLWQFYYNLCRCCRIRSQKGMPHEDDPKFRGLVEFRCIFFLVPYDHRYIWDTLILD